MLMLRGILVGVILVGFASIAGCAVRYETGFADLRQGMTEADVRELLGDPSVVVPGMRDEEGVLITGPRWQYGDNLSTLATAKAFPGTVPARVWAVSFDLQGQVSGFRPPVRVEAGGQSVLGDRSMEPAILPPATPSRER
ncbi:MAG: outer membrane protein assembly factor BamE [Phycisphaerales bacterium]|nr:outer membrane protein assembly factor BamE [Phycisphaerales bacterium]